MKGPSKSTGVGGSLRESSGREAQRKAVGRAIDQLRPDEPHFKDAAPEIKGDVAYCSSCHAIYRPKRWYLDEAEFKALSNRSEVETMTCPGCKALERGDFYGELHVQLKGMERHRQQILNTLYNEEGRAREKNPNERIGRLLDRGAEIEVDTLTPFLAHRMAKELVKAFHGSELDSDFASGQSYARITWYKPDKST